jgi:carbon monoxide dehydrogenase subunit G
MKKTLLVILVIVGAAYLGQAAYSVITGRTPSASFHIEFDNGGPTLKGSGHLVTENRTVPPFAAIHIASAANVVIDRTGTQALSVTADDNLVSGFASEVRDGTLYLSAHVPGLSFQTNAIPVYHVTVADLRAIDMSGSGNVKADHLDSPALSVTVAGSGNATLAGRADDVTFTIKGSGNVDAGGLGAKRAKVVVSGSGNATVNAADTLDIQMGGSGDLKYLGSPKVTQHGHGSGSVRHR